jgi:fumarate hydratase class II
VENFPISGLLPYRTFISSMAAIKGAAAQVNCELGLLEDESAAAIETAAREVMQGKWDAHFVVDPFQAGAGTSHNMNMNEVLANRATQILGGTPGEYRVHPNNHVNMAQSTNDTIPTAIRIGSLMRLAELEGVLQALADELEKKAQDFDHVLKSGRTHLQDAVPIRLGQEFSAYGRAIERDLERIRFAADRLRRLGIGGTATGTGLNAHPDYRLKMVSVLSEWTSLELNASDNLFESMQSMADMTAFSASIRTLAVTLTRIANDIRLLSSGPSTGLAEIRIPAVQPGSSIMPGKVNPVMAEMLNMAMYHVIGDDTAVMLASQAGQLELNVMMPVIAHNLFEMMQVTIGAVSAFTERCVSGIEADEQRTLELLERNAIVVTALNPLIGYSAGAELVKEAIASNRSVRELAVEKAESGDLKNVESGEAVLVEDVQNAFTNLYRLTEGGIVS